MATQQSPNIVFLLGSGISIPVGMPSTQAITDYIVSRKHELWKRADNEHWYFEGDPLRDSKADTERDLFDLISKLISAYYKSEAYAHTVNYEDIAFVVTQIHDSIYRELENPALIPMVEYIYYYFNLPATRQGRFQFEMLFTNARRLIRDIVWRSLIKKPQNLPSLDWLCKACIDPALSAVDIFTLNHDVVLEETLVAPKIEFFDGFGPNQKEIESWRPELYSNSSTKVRLCKLHGSINWFPIADNLHRVALETTYSSISDIAADINVSPNYVAPVLLIGTFNKIMRYSDDLFLQLQFHFMQRLRDCTTLVVCGYSFGDKAINSRVINWLNSSYNNRLMVIHPKPIELWNYARGALRSRFRDWRESGQLIEITKGSEDVSWEQVSDHIWS